jgi:hypothetical protein
MIAMCRPEMERICVRPESRIDWVTSSEMPARSPVMRATAISPVSPDKAALMRALIAALSASIFDHAARSHGGTGAPSNGATLLVA